MFSLASNREKFLSHKHRDITYIIIINLSGIFLNPIVVAYAIDPVTVTFWRCLFGALLFSPFLLIKYRKFHQEITKREFSYMFFAGLALATHFICLMQGLYQVSLGVALIVMSTSSIWAGVLGIFILKQILGLGQWVGLFVGVSGILLLVLTSKSLEIQNNSALVWLLISSVAGAFYLVTGEKIRATVINTTYVVLVYIVAALSALIYALITNNSLVVESNSDWIGILLITFFGQVMVHTVSNLYLRHGKAIKLKLSFLIQIPIVTIIGWFLFDQEMPLEVIPALIFTVIGFLIFTVAHSKSQRLQGHTWV